MKIRIKKGDTVKIITGSKDRKGKIGKIIEVDRKKMRVKVENIVPIKRHIKPQRKKMYPEGGIIADFGTIHISNVMRVEEGQ